ncbi:MAG: hypothetical protein KKD38_04435, partial [Candidatus Delongbacteria bacterium]|nr:hypothetical protein [Candidatus Delongbacteria bacterium]
KAKSIGYSTLGIGYMRKSAGYCTKRTKHGLSSEKNKQVEFDPFRYEISPMALDQLEFSIRESLTHILTTGIK